MEWSVFLITMGMLISFMLIGIGVCIGERVDKRQLRKCDNCPVLSDDTDSVSNCDMGGSDRQEHSGQDLGSDIPSPETIEAVLNIFRIHACRTECEVIDYLLSQERRQEDE